MNADEFEQKPAETVAEDKADHIMADKVPYQASPDPIPPKRSGSGTGLAVLAFLLALLALAAAAWTWWQWGQSQRLQTVLWQTQQQQYQDQLKQLESTVTAVKDSPRQSSSALTDDLQHRLEALEATRNDGEAFRAETTAWSRAAQAALEDSQFRLNKMDERLRNLSARSAESSTELELEEIDYLLRMAQERLELFGDTRSADRALQLADQQVAAFDNPMFIALRREITAARQALAAADVPDLVALGAEFDQVQESLSELVFHGSEVETGTVVESTDEGLPWWQRLKNALAGLVTVHRVDNAEFAVPVLADQLALRQRAWLQVEQARLAALSREQDIYQDALAQAQATISRWFAADDPLVRQALSALQTLQQRQVDPAMPDISGPWTTLRSIRDAGLSPAPAAASQADSQPAADTIDEPVKDKPQENPTAAEPGRESDQ